MGMVIYMVKDLTTNVKNVINELEYKKNYFFYHRIKKYVIDYRIDGDYLIVESNLGITRKVKNTSSNIKKINKTIVKNKVAIANQIDEYENNSYNRTLIMFLDIFILCGCGGIVPITLFMGSYILFLLSIILFSSAVLASCMMGLNLVIQIKEIQNLKQITGYKLEHEIKLPRIEMPRLKNKRFKDAN